MSEKKEITSAIINVMKSVKNMEKNSEVGSGNHAYRGTRDSDVKKVFNEALTENGLCIVPIEIDPTIKIDRWEEKNGNYTKQKQSVFTEVKTKYLLIHESGESLEVSGYGQGVDSMDKGAGKATTYALKNSLLYTFLTPVGGIDDTDTEHSKEIPVPPSQNKPEQPKQPSATIELTKEQFDKAMNSGIKGIVATINAYTKPGYKMKPEFFKDLSGRLAKLKNSK